MVAFTSSLLSPQPTRLMGILNVTPDSFSDGGQWDTPQAAVAHARDLLEAGADIIDVGGESTRPGSQRIAPEVEQRRIMPVVQALVDHQIPVSVDTLHASTAAACIAAGVDIINDVSGGLYDPEMASVIAGSSVLYICQHWRGTPDTMDSFAIYDDVVSDVRAELEERTRSLTEAGVDPGQIIWDPGLGFAKNAAQCWTLVEQMEALMGAGYPLLVGPSRKRFLATKTGPDATLEAKDQATADVCVTLSQMGVWAVRVHNVDTVRRAIGGEHPHSTR